MYDDVDVATDLDAVVAPGHVEGDSMLVTAQIVDGSYVGETAIVAASPVGAQDRADPPSGAGDEDAIAAHQLWSGSRWSTSGTSWPV